MMHFYHDVVLSSEGFLKGSYYFTNHQLSTSCYFMVSSIKLLHLHPFFGRTSIMVAVLECELVKLSSTLQLISFQTMKAFNNTLLQLHCIFVQVVQFVQPAGA